MVATPHVQDAAFAHTRRSAASGGASGGTVNQHVKLHALFSLVSRVLKGNFLLSQHEFAFAFGLDFVGNMQGRVGVHGSSGRSIFR